ncbi:hypothetical protein COHA_008609 [Chlorella ohadii]|uniref:Ubiquitin-like domain-containing protein n=1 Tax=Chlorella ohadii TaxID=2649997 RepID=A0AAD5DH54_9CHLO|nr:hypothetical protein COHA_008609 [Chlorella ohadii]
MIWNRVQLNNELRAIMERGLTQDTPWEDPLVGGSKPRDPAVLSAVESRGSLQVLVRMPDGPRTVVLHSLSPGTTGRTVKALIEAKTGFPASHLRLELLGRPFDDHSTLGGHMVTDGSTIHATARLRGGGPELRAKAQVSYYESGQDSGSGTEEFAASAVEDSSDRDAENLELEELEEEGGSDDGLEEDSEEQPQTKEDGSEEDEEPRPRRRAAWASTAAQVAPLNLLQWESRQHSLCIMRVSVAGLLLLKGFVATTAGAPN